MSIGSAARNCSNFQIETIPSQPALADAQSSGRDHEESSDDDWVRALQEASAPTLDPKQQKIIIDAAAFEACMKLLLLPEDEISRDPTAATAPPPLASTQGAGPRLVFSADDAAFRADQAADEICI